MRKLALFTTALLGLAYVSSVHAQPSQSAPQPGLPPGAAVGAPMAQQPRATGEISTTSTGMQSSTGRQAGAMPNGNVPAVSASTPIAPRPVRHRRVRRHHARRHMTNVAPVATPTAVPAQ